LVSGLLSDKKITVRQLISRYLEFSLPLKIFFAAVAGTIAGPGLLAFLSEYAAYQYALTIGIRPPVEGIPYLSATVALVSLILALLASLVFLITRWFFAFAGAQLIDMIENISAMLDQGLQDYRNKGGKFFKKFSVAEAISSIKRLSFLQVSILAVCLSVVFWLVIIKTSGFWVLHNVKVAAFAWAFYASIAIFSLWHRAFAWFVAVLAVILFYLFSIKALFNTEGHAFFLKAIGYGGGVPIIVEYERDRSQEKLNLAIRTTTSLMSMPDISGKYVEIPIDRVQRIIYQGWSNQSPRMVK
jgi:hypothetical protein